jgi:hypothetical protein
VAPKTIGGISGVLGELISVPPTLAAPTKREQSPPDDRKTGIAGIPTLSPVPSPPRARLGRPPGSSLQPAGPKEKVTLRVPCELIAEYRDWSWEVRCQLGELVERALLTYLNARRGHA